MNDEVKTEARSQKPEEKLTPFFRLLTSDSCSYFIVCFSPVAADGFDGAGDEGFFAESALLFGRGLFEDVGVAAAVVAREVVWGGVAAHVAVDASSIDVVLTGDVLRDLVAWVSHKEGES
jgi:hypothetical protein